MVKPKWKSLGKNVIQGTGHSWLLWQPTTTLFRHNQYIESLEFVFPPSVLDILKRYQVEEGQSGAELQGAQGLEQRGRRHMTQSFKRFKG
jgi:hypothetical protein